LSEERNPGFAHTSCMFGTKIAIAATACLLFSLPFSGLAAADAVHRIAFKVDPVVLVWQDKAEPTELTPAAGKWQ
ncbi:MAG: hypothetical protein AAFY43_02440, partial [Pseudomonadota bacterium]